jgi:molybdopterin molybdotransferase
VADVTRPAVASAQPTGRLSWAAARRAAYEAGLAAQLDPVTMPLAACDGTTLAEDLRPVTDLPAFPTASVDGFAIRGRGPWRVVRRILAGETAGNLGEDGTAAQVATGAMVPGGTEAIVRAEDARADADGLVTGVPRHQREWRLPGEEASRGDVLLPAGTPVTPAIIGLAAAGGRDGLRVRPRPRAALLVSGDELLTRGPAGGGRIRDSLGPQLPAWLGRLGADADPPADGPLADALGAHVAAIRQAQGSGAAVILVTGGTMHGPADYLRSALHDLGAAYLIDTVAVRPARPMLLASLAPAAGRPALLAGLPGNPQPAVVALLTLVAPVILGLTGRTLPELATVELAAPLPGRGQYTRVALVRLDADGRAHPLPHAASSALRGLAQAAGFAVIGASREGSPGDHVPFLPLPLLPGEHP